MDFLRGAVDAVAELDPQVAAAGHWGKVGLLNAWHARLSVALQKGTAACTVPGEFFVRIRISKGLMQF